MLRVVKKQFDVDFGISLRPGDIVDDSSMKHAIALLNNGYLGETDARKPTVEIKEPKKKSTSSEPAKPRTSGRKLKTSALTSRPRVFKPRKA